MTLYDEKWNSQEMDTKESVKEAFAIIERPTELRNQDKLLKRKPGTKRTSGPSDRRWTPLVCEGEEVCSWLISRQKLHPSPIDDSMRQTKKLYRSTWGDRADEDK